MCINVKKPRALLFACTPFCHTPGTAKELGTHSVPRVPGHTRGAHNPETQMLGDDGIYAIYGGKKEDRSADRDSQRERKNCGERGYRFFLSPSDESTTGG